MSAVSAVPSHRGGSAALVAALCAGSFAGGLFLPLSLVYFTVLTDIPLELLGVLLTLAGLVAVPLPLLAGWTVDRYGARACVLLALCLQSLGYLGFVVARHPVAVFGVSSVMAVGSRLFWSSIFALVAHHAEARTGPEGRSGEPVEWWFAAVNTTRTVGVVCGGLLAGVVITLGQDGGYLALAWVAAACCAAAAVLVRVGAARPGRRRSLTSRPASLRRGRAPLADRGFLALMALNAVFASSTLSLGLSLPTLVRSGLHGPGWLTSVLLVVNAGLVAVLGAWGGRLAARRPGLVLLRWAGMLWAGAFAVLARAAVLDLPVAAAALLVAVVALSAAEVLHAPASATLVTVVAGPARRDHHLAVFQYSFVAAELVGPVVFTSTFALSPATPFLLLALLNALAVPASVGVARLLHRDLESVGG